MARRGSPCRTGEPVWTQPSTSGLTTSRPTHWLSRKARSWGLRFDEATKYELADQILGAAGFGWYEVSNWARTEADRCRHNEGYWLDGDWWGVGPGAHSHVGGVRWWNVKHPNAFATRLNAGLSPAAGRELLTDDQRYDERVLLGVRLCLLYTSPSPRDRTRSRMPSSA